MNNLVQNINYVVKIIFQTVTISNSYKQQSNKKNVFDFGERLSQIFVFTCSYSILSTHIRNIVKRVPFDYEAGSKSATR